MTQSAREKISLFHLCRIVMWAICRVVRVMVVAMVNFIPMMSFWLGSIVVVFGLCFCVVFMVIFLVRAFLSQSVMFITFFWWVRWLRVLRPPFRKEFRSCFASSARIWFFVWFVF